jgi:hypothetical protein
MVSLIPERSIKYLHFIPTGSEKEQTVEQLVLAHRKQGGLDCSWHFLLTRRGRLYPARPLNLAPLGSLDAPGINAESIAIGVTGKTLTQTSERQQYVMEALSSLFAAFAKTVRG